MPEMDFITFKALAEDGLLRPQGWRAGQTAFNALYELRPDLSGRIRGDHARLDPYYRDENLPAFWEFVEDQWGAGS